MREDFRFFSKNLLKNILFLIDRQNFQLFPKFSLEKIIIEKESQIFFV